MTQPARVIVISARDNVATALDPLAAGTTIDVDGRAIVVRESIAGGHKIALTRIAAHEPVIKYGSPIGTATHDIEPGVHVHTHNVASTRGRGDLAAQRRSGDAMRDQPSGLPRLPASRRSGRRAKSRPRRPHRRLLGRRDRTHRRGR